MLDDATVEQMKGLLEENPDLGAETGLVIDVEDPVISLLLEALAERAQYLNEVGLEYLISRLKQLYVEKLPDKGLSSNDFSDAYKDKLDNAASNQDLMNTKYELLNIINAIQGISYLVVSELPSKGAPGVIYLLRLKEFTTVKNLYEEYIWVQDRYELLGSVEVGGDQDGPFVTVDDFALTLKKYIQNIVIGGTTIGPNTSGAADIGDAILNLIKAQVGTIGSVTKVSVNGTTYNPTNGLITLMTLAHTVKINGSTKTVSSAGLADLGTISAKVNGTTYDASTAGLISLPTLAHTATVNGVTFTATSSGNLALTGIVGSVKVNGTTYSPTDGLITLMNLIKSVTVNGSTYSASSTGTVTLMNLVKSITVNGTTYSASSTGTVNLGTIGGGNTVYTGTTEPASTLGSDNDFYYKFPS